MPFVTPFEMANQDAAEVVSRLKNSPDTLRLYMKAFATDSFSDPNQTLLNIGAAIGAYETEDVAEFEPFTSKLGNLLPQGFERSEPCGGKFSTCRCC